MADMLWIQKQDIGPRPRVVLGMAYDSVRKKVVLFGGYPLGGGTIGDTWEWDGNEWIQVADTGPEARCNHAVAFDTKRRRIVLFGGQRNKIPFGDTWVWDGSEWTQEQDSGPSSRAAHALAYDSERDRIVLFGGLAGTEFEWKLVNDTWEYDSARWIRVADTGPSPRSGHGMIYDGTKVLLFGGDGGSGDTWEWDGTHWKELQNMGPPPRGYFGMAYDSARKHTTLYGGEGINANLLGDTWEWYDHPPR